MKVVDSHDTSLANPRANNSQLWQSGSFCGKGDVRRSLPHELRWQSRCVPPSDVLALEAKTQWA